MSKNSKRPAEDHAVDAGKSKKKSKETSEIDSELLGKQPSSTAAAAVAAVAKPDAKEKNIESDKKPEDEEEEEEKQEDEEEEKEEEEEEESKQVEENSTPVVPTPAVPVPAERFQNYEQTGSDEQPEHDTSKPPHGTEEWHKQRRENHKEVERKRREAINIGIRELAKLIPTTDTNKAQILQRSVEFIKRLKENENNNIEKWTLEKLLTEQAVSELSASNEKLKHELELAYREIEQLKRANNKK
ncbi:CBF1 Transcriptional regulator CBF1 [Candida maltosa Xu316]|uniref:Centromere DNA binding protein, putative (Transcriptional activator of sulfur metabolism, putative) n=1 Tax=Candida maltosa (strain Xu316) TaxID=1245528 RepID=M3JVU2_CANMX|nr:Centromere DNA binding protein, putative (Transcriptional activator of sulfur metabolism, putative) [Candida maltosa Xu316]